MAQGVTAIVESVPPSAQIAVFMAFAALFTNFVSNSAAAAVGTPIAIATAQQLGSPLEPFVLAILFGANLSYARRRWPPDQPAGDEHQPLAPRLPARRHTARAADADDPVDPPVAALSL